MTERLATLLKEEAGNLDIPTPHAPAVLRAGRRVRGRRRVITGLSAAAVVSVIAGVSFVALTGGDTSGRGVEEDTIDAASASYLSGGAFSAGRTVYFGDRALYQADLPEDIKSLYYTSEGVVVRTGDNPYSDDPGPSHYSLVTPTGRVQRLDLDLGDRVPSTDPDQPYLAYADRAGDGWVAVVRDVGTDEEVARVPVPGDFTWGGWAAPPVALSGDTVFVGMDQAGIAVDWRDATTTVADRMGPAEYPSAGGGRDVATAGRESTVYDVASGEVLLRIPVDPARLPYVTLSPDGRYAELVNQDESEGTSFEVYDVDSGASRTIQGAAWDFGWTPDGNLFSVSRTRVTVCQPATAECETNPVEVGPGGIKLGGKAYES
ncbi:hypothetical protein NOCA2350009 [metagenome]|uniref:Uncharacterized protein n=1 Tax=metagenome TaxID=256318 RepID=A0A2P2C385_9ZZZZ